MANEISRQDKGFLADFESGEYPIAEFDHRAHLRAAYGYLIDNDSDKACQLMREGLKSFLENNGVDGSKYHETITRAWILAVKHFMESTPDSVSADSFIDQNPQMLDSKIMMSHYSAEVLFSDEARAKFVEPDRSPIPRYDK